MGKSRLNPYQTIALALVTRYKSSEQEYSVGNRTELYIAATYHVLVVELEEAARNPDASIYQLVEIYEQVQEYAENDKAEWHAHHGVSSLISSVIFEAAAFELASLVMLLGAADVNSVLG